MVADDYDHIWDCCCDHGFLGAALLTRHAAPNIHFVDIVPELMQNVATRLEQFFSNSASTWHTHCLDVAALPLETYSGRHLVIIAGVGGDLMTRFINALQVQYSHLDIDFLICPVYQQYAVRKQLNMLNLSLLDEVLIEDNQRFYEVILLSSHPVASFESSEQISLVGKRIWDASTPQQEKIAQQYLTKTLQHYQRMLLSQSEIIQPIIKAYQSVCINTLFKD